MCHAYEVLFIHHHTGTEPESVITKCIKSDLLLAALFSVSKAQNDLDFALVVLDPDSVSACHQ